MLSHRDVEPRHRPPTLLGAEAKRQGMSVAVAVIVRVARCHVHHAPDPRAGPLAGVRRSGPHAGRGWVCDHSRWPRGFGTAPAAGTSGPTCSADSGSAEVTAAELLASPEDYDRA